VIVAKLCDVGPSCLLNDVIKDDPSVSSLFDSQAMIISLVCFVK